MKVIPTSLVIVGVLMTTTKAPGQSSGTHHVRRALGTALVPKGTLYSPGVVFDDTIYISGLQGTDPETHTLPADFAKEVHLCLDNVGHVLSEGGMSYEDVVTVQIFLTDIKTFDEVNAAYKTYFTKILPARAVVAVSQLSLGSRIEISAIARK